MSRPVRTHEIPSPPVRIHRHTQARVAVLAVALISAVLLLVLTLSAEATGSGFAFSALDAVILGLVEGITEYLPVSSTGHLLVTTELLGLSGNAETERLLDAYAICIQAGAILAVLVVYLDRIRQMVDGILGRSEEGRRLVFAIAGAFVPTAIIAQFAFPLVRTHLFGLGAIAAAWIVGGLVILVLSRTGYFERPGQDLDSLTVRHAAIIGLLQAIAIWPGTSRSLVTIIAGILVGLSLRAAVEFSFLLGLVTLSAATVYAAAQDGPAMIETFGWVNPLLGLVVAFVSAVLAVRWMVSYLNDRGFEIFGYYRILIGILVLPLVF